MKLSELIAYKSELTALSALTTQRSADQEIAKITHLAENSITQFKNFTEILQQHQQLIYQSFSNFETHLNGLKEEVNAAISLTEPYWFSESYRLYEEEMCHETNDYILSRRPALTTETELLMRSRLSNYATWEYPGMIIRPGVEPFIRDLVSYDPLYLVDQHYDLLTPTMKQFPEQYQNRLRTYIIKESTQHKILEKIPNEQFAMCLVYNFFEFRPFEVIKQYLNEIYQKLRPGGVLVMTFNDCDNWQAVNLVERHFACYTPGYLVRDLAKTIGYEQVFVYNNDTSSTWLELRKPGELMTLKGGQSLAKVVAKPK